MYAVCDRRRSAKGDRVTMAWMPGRDPEFSDGTVVMKECPVIELQWEDALEW